MFSKTAVVSSFINAYLFPNIEIDYSLSSAIKNDTVDGFLNEFRSDIVYRLFDKTNARFIYLLFEHKSTPDKKTLVQIKHYLNSIENDIPEGEKHEGPIPVVIYHGRRKWRISLSLDLDHPDPVLHTNFSRLQYLLFDFYHTPDEEIHGSPQLPLTLMALKYVKTRLINKKIDPILVILREMIDEKDVAEYVDELALYIDSAAPSDLKVKVQEKIKTAIITGENKMSSIKEYFKQEGRKEGKEEGRMEGRKEGIEEGVKQEAEKIALNMLKNGESTEKVALYTGLPEEKITNLYTQLIKNIGKNDIRK
jgi:predicted transposase/invertase (TIGR01784 family)